MSLGSFFGRLGDNISSAPPEAWFGLAQALASTKRPGQGLALGLSQFGQALGQDRRKKSLAEALKGMSEGMTPQQRILLEQFPELAAPEMAKSAFDKKQASGPFAGTGFDASAANILVEGQKDPSIRSSPQYAIAYSNLTSPKVVTDAEGRQMLYTPPVPKGIMPPMSGQPSGEAPAAPQLRPSIPPAARPSQQAAPQVPVAPYSEPTADPVASAMPPDVVTATPGGVTPIPGTGKTPTEAQLKSSNYYTRMTGAAKTLNDETALEKYMEFGNWAKRAGGDWTEWMQGDEAQTYSTAAREWLAGLLRLDSGAQITAQDIQQLGPAYIPERGDSDSRLAYKAAARKRAEQAMRSNMLPEQILKAEGIVRDNPAPTLQKQFPAPPQEAIRDLKMRRDKAAFDEVFGPGAADKYLGK